MEQRYFVCILGGIRMYLFEKYPCVRLPGNLHLGSADAARIDLHLCPLAFGRSSGRLGAARNQEMPGLSLCTSKSSQLQQNSWLAAPCTFGTEELAILKICR